VREEPFLQPADEHHVELEPLRRVHRHQLDRIGALGRLPLARLERGVREERVERIDRRGLTLGGVGRELRRRALVLPERGGGVHQLARFSTRSAPSRSAL
jgi:hypothetical protein